MRNYLYGHISQETAYVVEDYPWGFRLRTTIRYWIESKKNKGQRFCSQTIDPKKGTWCKPKYSTYSVIVVMYLNEIDHIHTEHVSHYTSEIHVQEFAKNHEGKLDTFQEDELCKLLAYHRVMKHVTVTCEVVQYGESERRLKEREESLNKINRAINYEYSKMKANV